MKRLIKSILLTTLVIIISGCSGLNTGLGSNSKEKINDSLPVISAKSVRSISDITAMALEWKGYNIPNVYGYYIYRSEDGQRFTKIATIKNKFASHYLDTDLKPETKYMYSIAIIGNDGTQSRLSKPIQSTTLKNFESVSFSIAISNLPRLVKILWRPHTNRAVEYYEIERKDIKRPKWRKIATVDNRLNAEYINTKLKDNHTYSYRIKSVTFDDVESQYSQAIQATTKALPKTTNKIEATTNIARKIIVTWQASTDTNVLGYNIYSSRSKSGYYTKVASAKKHDNTYEDILNKNDEIRYYKITTIDKDKLETNKNALPVVFGKTLELPKTPKITLGLIRNNAVIINWDKSDNRAIHYNMHKTIKEGFFKSKSMIFKNINSLRFIDKEIVRGVNYEYELESVDENGLVSKKTKEISLNIPKLKSTK